MNQSPFDNAEYDSKPSGYILVDGVEVATTKQCCHCGKHFISVKGSGRTRGWCVKCKKVECGDPQCFVCVPYRAKLDFLDGGNGSRSKKWDLDIAELIGKYKELHY